MKLSTEITKSNYQKLRPGDSVNVYQVNYLDRPLQSMEDILENGLILADSDKPQVYKGLVITTSNNLVCITCPTENLKFEINKEKFEGSKGDLYRIENNSLVQIAVTKTVRTMEEKTNFAKLFK